MSTTSGTVVDPCVRRPVLVRTRAELLEARGGLDDGPVAVVMTMGALHEGHATLIRQARERACHVVVTVFLNPLQFSAGEDLSRYPRTLDSDLVICAREGVDLVFAPTPDVVYPEGEPGVRISAGPLGDVLEGQARPGHFDGVLTVVAKLFGLVRPDLAVFGQKDYQQLTLIRRMVRDLCMDIEIVGAETVREADGLALSSRNRYLDPEQRQAAVALSRALRAAQERAPYGVPAARGAAMSVLQAEPGLELDYLALTSPDLGEAPETGKGRILVAARLGTTRLIDNTALVFDQCPPPPTARGASPSSRERSEPDVTEPTVSPAKPVDAPPTSEASA